MPELTPQQTADNLAAITTNALGEFAPVLTGSGAEAFKEFQQLEYLARELPGIGAKAQEQITALMADPKLPDAHKQAEAARVHGLATDVTRAARNALVQTADNLRAKLAEATKPVPMADAGTRALRRQELEILMAGTRPELLAVKMHELLGRNPEHDAELLSEWGAAKLAGSNPAELKLFHDGAIGKLVQQPTGTPKQRAAKLALVAFDKSQLKGMLAGAIQAAEMNLSGSKPAPAPDSISAGTYAAPTPQVLQSKARFK